MFSDIQSAAWSSQVDDVLKEWRTRAVTIILYIIVAYGGLVCVTMAANAIGTGLWLRLGVMSAAYLAVVVMAVNKTFDYRLRGWVILSAAYIIAVVHLTNTGLEGAGRIYLMATPVGALVLIGNRAGLIATILSTLIFGTFSLFAYSGLLGGWLYPLAERTDPSMWITSGVIFIFLLILNFILLLRMNRFLLNTLKQERRSSAELEQTYDETLESWAHALELRDIETADHCHRVCEITKRLAGDVGLAGGRMDDLHRGALLHDVGKMGIPDSVLLNPDKLTDEELGQMHEHTKYAYDLLAHIPYLHKALDIPYCHHEKWDGTGYPRRLKGTEIPLSARIFSVADAYDELISDHPHRGAWPEEQALAYISERAGTEFDPAVVEAFVRLAEEEACSLEEM
jgi:hypothetical protein